MDFKEAVKAGVEQLKSGNIILCPTDTIWGLSCDATNEEAVEKLFQLKKREPSKSFIILVNSNAMVNNCFKDIPEVVWDLLDLSTSPLSIVMDGGQYVAKNAIKEDGSIAFRWIKEGYCHELLKQFRKPIISTSPNLSNEPSPINFESISPYISSKVDYIVPKEFAQGMTGRASKIIKVKSNGEVQIIRK